MVDSLNAILSEGKSVMLVTFYREQYHNLMLLSEKLGLVGTRVQVAKQKTERYFINPLFRICTVDASQGSESDVVVLSCRRTTTQIRLSQDACETAPPTCRVKPSSSYDERNHSIPHSYERMVAADSDLPLQSQPQHPLMISPKEVCTRAPYPLRRL